MYRSNRGFTLIELLVVITIIGILVALIIPAVNMVREESRQTKCLNNQIQLGKAIIAYEAAKNKLPGVLNQTQQVGGAVGTMVPYNWVEAIFPYLDRADLWDAVITGKTTSIAQTRWGLTTCPNDPFLDSAPTSSNLYALLSFGVNDGYFVSYLKNPAVDKNGTVVAPAITSKLTSRPNASFPRGEAVSAQTTIMLGERTGNGTGNTVTGASGSTQIYGAGAGNYTSSSSTAVNWISTVTPATAWSTTSNAGITFIWPAQATTGAPGASVAISPYILVSNHPGKVIVVFFDGHGEKVANETVYPQ